MGNKLWLLSSLYSNAWFLWASILLSRMNCSVGIFFQECTETDLTSQAGSSPARLPLQFDMDPLARKARLFLKISRKENTLLHALLIHEQAFTLKSSHPITIFIWKYSRLCLGKQIPTLENSTLFQTDCRVLNTDLIYAAKHSRVMYKTSINGWWLPLYRHTVFLNIASHKWITAKFCENFHWQSDSPC